MQAVILAAGMSRRLLPLTKNYPKAFLPVHERPLIEYSLDALHENGIDEVIIVVGYKKELFVNRLSHYKSLKISFIENQKYDTTGSMYSLWCARKYIRGDILLLESDLLYEPRALATIIASRYQNCILVSNIRGTGDEVFVRSNSVGHITALGKNVADDDKKHACGELVGISKLSGSFLPHLFKQIEGEITRNNTDGHYEEQIFRTAEKMPVSALVYHKLAWTEIDTKSDLERAVNDIYPLIFKKVQL